MSDWGEINLGHNRRRVRADGTVDPSVAVVAFDTPDGEPIATLINLAIHPVVLGLDNLEHTADFAGAMVALVERGVGG